MRKLLLLFLLQIPLVLFSQPTLTVNSSQTTLGGTYKGIEINNGAILTIVGDITITDNIIINNGKLILQTPPMGEITLDQTSGNFEVKCGSCMVEIQVFTNLVVQSGNFDNDGGMVTVDGVVNVNSGSFNNKSNGTVDGGGIINAPNGISNEGTFFGSTDDPPASCIGGTCDSPLPVELIQFTGQARNDRIKIEWATSVEVNNDYFQLERSKDGFDFTVIGRVNGQGSTTELTRYSYEDEVPLEGLNYYRLAQYDIDGSREYSDVIVISMGQLSDGLSNFYPNPTNEGLTQVNYFSDKDTPLVIRLQDMSGRLIETYRRDLIQGNNTLSFNLKDQHSGVYVVTFEDGNGIKKTKRLVIK